MTTVVLAEKPSMARDIAAVLGATKRGDGFIEGGGYRVTWAVGHLVRLAEPNEADAAWKRWSMDVLPMVPSSWPLVVASPKVQKQWKVVRRLLTAKGTRQVVVATDAGREGELIWRYIAELCECKKPARRLWISSLTPDAIREGFRNLRPASDFDALADAAVARSRADWLVGMNLTRLHTLKKAKHKEVYSVGRVQTPTLAMVVRRDQEIRQFEPAAYKEIAGKFEAGDGAVAATYVWRGFNDKGQAAWNTRLGLGEAEEPTESPEEIAERARTGQAIISSVKRTPTAVPPPLLYDLTDLQRDANRLLGLSAAKTLAAAQELYEKHKVLSYPRTDCRHLSATVAEGLPEAVNAISGRYGELVPASAGRAPLGGRFVQDKKVTEHHALIPTGKVASNLQPDSDAGRIYDLVCRRLLGAWAPDCLEAKTEVVVLVEHAAGTDRYEASGKSIEKPGWRMLQLKPPKGGAEQIAAGLNSGDAAVVADILVRSKRTQPPKPFTEAMLLGAMENSARRVEDKQLADAMRDRGLGTPATRAATIEGLISRGYLQRDKTVLRATPKGTELVAAVHKTARSPAMTAEWEFKLRRIEQGALSLDDFMREVEGFVTQVVRASA